MRREWLNGPVSCGWSCPFKVNLLSFRPDVKGNLFKASRGVAVRLTAGNGVGSARVNGLDVIPATTAFDNDRCALATVTGAS